MAKTLSITSLIPERNTLDFEDGTPVVDMVSMQEMDTTDYAGFMRMAARADGMKGDLEDIDGTSDPEQAMKVMTDLNGLLGDLLKTLMPSIESERLDGIRLGVRVGILDWWFGENELAPKVLGQESQS